MIIKINNKKTLFKIQKKIIKLILSIKKQNKLFKKMKILK